MGLDYSKISSSQMPSFYVAKPEISLDATAFLDRCLLSVVHGSSAKSKYIPFTKFYVSFFNRFGELSNPNDEEIGYGLGSYCLESKSFFLVQLLKFVTKAPSNSFLGRKNGKWQTSERRRLKKFIAHHQEVCLETYTLVGEALFFAVAECDELYTNYVERAWVEGYSLLLKQVAMIIIKRSTWKALLSSEHDGDIWDGVVDWSDGNFSDSSSPSRSRSNCSSYSATDSAYESSDDEYSRDKSGRKQNRLAVRLAKFKVKKKMNTYRSNSQRDLHITENSVSDQPRARHNSWSLSNNSESSIRLEQPALRKKLHRSDTADTHSYPRRKFKAMPVVPVRQHTDPTVQRVLRSARSPRRRYSSSQSRQGDSSSQSRGHSSSRPRQGSF